MTSEIKLIALDLDGTLLNSQKQISSANIAAITAARNAGVAVVLTTGRPLKAILPYLETLDMQGFDDFSITFNGGLIQRNTGQILAKNALTLDEASQIKALCDQLGWPCDLLNEGTVYMTSEQVQSLYPQINNLLDFKTAKLSELSHDLLINKIVSATDAENLDSKIPDIPANFYEKYEIFKTQPRLIEFMPKGINKAFGLSKLIEILDLKPANVMAMGDEENDLSMIEWAGYGVAMANGIDRVKQAAKIISPWTNDQDGVGKIIEKYVL